jgi:predicted ATPase
MALPGAQILSFNQSPPAPIDFDDIEHVSLMHAFLSAPEAFVRRL